MAHLFIKEGAKRQHSLQTHAANSTAHQENRIALSSCLFSHFSTTHSRTHQFIPFSLLSLCLHIAYIVSFYSNQESLLDLQLFPNNKPESHITLTSRTTKIKAECHNCPSATPAPQKSPIFIINFTPFPTTMTFYFAVGFFALCFSPHRKRPNLPIRPPSPPLSISSLYLSPLFLLFFITRPSLFRLLIFYHFPRFRVFTTNPYIHTSHSRLRNQSFSKGGLLL